MSRVIQAIIDEAMKLESDLTKANECLDDVIAQREECKQQLALITGDLHDLQRELEKPRVELRRYEDQIRHLQDQINTLKNTPRAPSPWDNRMVLLAGYGTVLAIHLYEQGWSEAAISNLACPAPMLIPTYSEWYMKYGQANGWMPPEPLPPPPMPGLPSAPPFVLSDDQSHWVAVPDDEPEAVLVDEVELPDSGFEKILEEKVLKARRRRENADE